MDSPESPRAGVDPVAETDWRKALQLETNFWRSIVSGQRGEFVEQFNSRFDPNRPLQFWAWKWIDIPAQATARILDVGSGPISILGTNWPGHPVELTAVDPLAEKYNQILAEFGQKPPVPTIYGEAERLTEQFPVNTFDLVYSRNALDHTYDSPRAIEQCLEVAKPGGTVLLHHFTNEAEKRNYEQLHQWNLCWENDAFIVWNKKARVNLSERFEGRADIHVEEATADWLALAIKKRAT